MQSSLVKPSAISSSKKAASRGSSCDSRLCGSSCFYTQSPGHLLPLNPTIMSTLVAQHLSAGTPGEDGQSRLGGRGGVCSTLRQPTMAVQQHVQSLAQRQESIRMFSYHMLLQGSERRPPVESHTKYRPPISMDLKSYSFYKGAH